MQAPYPNEDVARCTYQSPLCPREEHKPDKVMKVRVICQIKRISNRFFYACSLIHFLISLTSYCYYLTMVCRTVGLFNLETTSIHQYLKQEQQQC